MILEQDHFAAMVFVRDEDRFVVETVTRGGTLLTPEIGIEVPIDELYRGVEPDEPDEPAEPAEQPHPR